MRLSSVSHQRRIPLFLLFLFNFTNSSHLQSQLSCFIVFLLVLQSHIKLLCGAGIMAHGFCHLLPLPLREVLTCLKPQTRKEKCHIKPICIPTLLLYCCWYYACATSLSLSLSILCPPLSLSFSPLSFSLSPLVPFFCFCFFLYLFQCLQTKKMKIIRSSFLGFSVLS